MKTIFPLFVAVLCLACSTGQPSGLDAGTEGNGGTSTPCASDSDCGVWGVCVQGVCREGTSDGATTGAVEGSNDGTSEPDDAGMSDGSATGGSTESVDAGMSDGSATGGSTESVDAGIIDGASDGNDSEDVNLALTATAEASEEWDTITWPAEKAIDGDMTTYWSTADGLVTATFTVTLSETKVIDTLVINCGDYPIKSFDLQLSSDGFNYFSIGQYATVANESKTITFLEQTTTSVRLESITADPGPVWTVAAINELEIYGPQ